MYVHKVLHSQFACLFFINSAAPLMSYVTLGRNLTSLNFSFLNCKMGIIILTLSFIESWDSFNIHLENETCHTHIISNGEHLWDLRRGIVFSSKIYRWENQGYRLPPGRDWSGTQILPPQVPDHTEQHLGFLAKQSAALFHVVGAKDLKLICRLCFKETGVLQAHPHV